MKTLILTLGFLFTVNASAAVDVEALFAKFDENCSGNDSSRIYKSPIYNVTLEKAVQFAKKSDSDGIGNDCSDGRAYPRKRSEIVKAFELRMEDLCKDAFTEQEYVDLISLLTDETNLAVSASLYSGNDNSEACDYDHYFIFREHGLVIDLTFNVTD